MRESVKPMTLQNMRANGVRMAVAQCESCGHTAERPKFHNFILF